VFRERAADYDRWYERHRAIYASELAAVERLGCGGCAALG
jgi:hypothetical protein